MLGLDVAVPVDHGFLGVMLSAFACADGEVGEKDLGMICVCQPK